MSLVDDVIEDPTVETGMDTTLEAVTADTIREDLIRGNGSEGGASEDSDMHNIVHDHNDELASESEYEGEGEVDDGEYSGGEGATVDGMDDDTDNETDYGGVPFGSPRHLRAIEVVLGPPSAPDSYIRIPRSRTVLRALEVTGDSKPLWEVEFEDGYTKRVTYDDATYYKGGLAAIETFQRNNMARSANKRSYSDDEYEHSDSDYGNYSKRRKYRELSSRYSRRSTRQSSRHSSVDHDELAMNDAPSQFIDDESDEHSVRQSVTRSRRSVELSRTTRLTRSHNSARQAYTSAAGSDDELALDNGHDGNADDDDDGDYFQIIQSDIGPKPKNSKRKKARVSVRKVTRRDDSDSSIEFETSRRSTRSTKNVKSMKDPEIDDYEVVEERHTNAPKHTAIKEVFQELDKTSVFRKMHSETCESCRAESGGAKNPLVYCQGCSFSYHRTCIGPRAAREHRVTKIGSEHFVLQCRFCIQTYKKKDARAPNQALCQVCKTPGASCNEFSTKKTPKQEEKARTDNGGEDPISSVDPLLINNPDHVLFRCTHCKRGYHFEHLPSLNKVNGDIVGDDDDQDLKLNRLEEYSMVEWSCKDCVDTSYKMSALVAWRPLDQATYITGQTSQDYLEDDIEYLIKWATRSHFHDTWMPGAWVFGVALGPMRYAFHKRDSSTYPKMDKASAIEEEWLLADVLLNVKYRTRVNTSSKAEDLERINDITSVFVKFQGLSYEEVVWDDPPARDSGAAWEAFVAAYDEYLNGKYFVMVPDYKMRERLAHFRSLDFGKECELKSQPPQLKKGKLMEYQIEGVNFLLYNFHQQQNVILADEMGLGKTVQIVAFISALTHLQPGCWPFLVVVPNATCPNWRRELKQWAPDLRVVTYHGGKVAQDLAYRHELYPEGTKGGMKAHVVIMSYEAAASTNNVFQSVKWVGLIVDEGQRLKNEDTMLYKSLLDMKIPCRILLTGTPLQNNKRELFNLLQFIDKTKNAKELDEQYSELTKENLPKLHNLIRPYFLRRTKAQVLKFLPPMAQIILPVTMTVVQEKLSKSIMARNPELIKAIISSSKLKAGERKSMNNILSDLRQCLCHPFCFNGEIEDKTVDMAQMHRNLIEASPKLLLLELMLPKLKEGGHRVLIFSQYLHSLTIIEDFLTGLDLAHARIDGTLSALEKQKRIDAFNAPDSSLFAMLLSTRAGGVGINLATADTVIIYDPDFNPHQDLQALSRAHRIGQKHKVLCFQLMTKNTVEEKIMQMGRKKMALDHALIESMDAKEEAGEDLESILKHGAAALFSDGSKDKITYDDASVDKLLDRSTIENTNTADDSAETQFSFARIWANDNIDLTTKNTVDVSLNASTNTSIWENILKEREDQHKRELAANQKVYGRGARRRGQIDYKTNRVGFIDGVDDIVLTLDQPREADSGGSDAETNDELYIDQNEVEDEDSDEYGAAGETSSKTPKGIKEPQEAPKDTRLRNKAHPSPPGPAPLPPAPHPSQPAQAQFPTVLTQHPVNNSSHHLHPMPSRPQSLTTAPYLPGAIIPSVIDYLPAVQPPAVRLPNGQITLTGWVGGGNPCALCARRHSISNPCINLNSEASLRLALDRLRVVSDNAGILATRKFFVDQLHYAAARRQSSP